MSKVTDNLYDISQIDVMGNNLLTPVPENALFTDTSELEKIDEGLGFGWRLLGKISDFFSGVGKNAIDLSDSDIVGPYGASGENSIATGFRTKSTGKYSATSGTETIAQGEASFASGKGTIADTPHSFATGRYNKTETGTLFVVGSGTDDSTRENSIEVYEDGRVHAPKLSVDKQTDSHSFITKAFIDELKIDCGIFG